MPMQMHSADCPWVKRLWRNSWTCYCDGSFRWQTSGHKSDQTTCNPGCDIITSPCIRSEGMTWEKRQMFPAISLNKDWIECGRWICALGSQSYHSNKGQRENIKTTAPNPFRCVQNERSCQVISVVGQTWIKMWRKLYRRVRCETRYHLQHPYIPGNGQIHHGQVFMWTM